MVGVKIGEAIISLRAHGDHVAGIPSGARFTPPPPPLRCSFDSFPHSAPYQAVRVRTGIAAQEDTCESGRIAPKMCHHSSPDGDLTVALPVIFWQ